MNLQKWTASVVILGFLIFNFLVAWPEVLSAAGNCYCIGTTKDCSSGVCLDVPENKCAPAWSLKKGDAPQPINSEADCQKAEVAGEVTPDRQTTYSQCFFADSCAAATVARNGQNYTKIEKECAKAEDCSQWGENNFCLKGASGSFCYLDVVALNKYKNTVTIQTPLKDLKLTKPALRIGIPGVQFTDLANTVDSDGNIVLPWIGEYLAGVYRYAMVIGSIVAAVMIIMQGFQIVTSGGGEQKSEAYNRIMHVVIGLVLLWGSYFILYTINTDLVTFKSLKIQFIKPVPIPEEPESIDEKNYPVIANVGKPYWDKYTFDCSKKDSYSPMGVVGESALEKDYRCDGIEGKITTIKEMKDPLCKVAALAKKDGYTLKINPGGSFRSFKQQVTGWCDDTRLPDQKSKFRATPGYSNHGHGRAVDIFLIKDNTALTIFGSSAQCKTDEKYVKLLASYFEQADAFNFSRLDTEIWHYEYGTSGQAHRVQGSAMGKMPPTCK